MFFLHRLDLIFVDLDLLLHGSVALLFQVDAGHVRVYLVIQMLYLSLVVYYLVVEEHVPCLILFDALRNFPVLVSLQLLDLLFESLALPIIEFGHWLHFLVGGGLQLGLVVVDIGPQLDDFLFFMVH